MLRSFYVNKRDMTAGTANQGGNTIATDKAGLLDDFFASSVMNQLGATVLTGLTGNLDIPILAAGTAAAGKAENVAADEVSPTTSQLSLTPKRLPAFIDISDQLLSQSSSAIEAMLRGHLTAQMLESQEKAFFHGGGTNEANGVAGASGICNCICVMYFFVRLLIFQIFASRRRAVNVYVNFAVCVVVVVLKCDSIAC